MELNNYNDTDMRLISIPEACKRLGIGSWAMYQQINKRSIKTVKIGGRRLVCIKSLNEFIVEMER